MIYFPTTVVLIDDEPDFLDVVTTQLSDLNATLKLFNNFQEAKEYLTEYQHSIETHQIYPPANPEDQQEWLDQFTKKHPDIISCVIADENIHEHSGSALLEMVPSSISKILLTGAVDTTGGIEALNNQKIGKFIAKDNVKQMLAVSELVENEIDRFFINNFRLNSSIEEAKDLLYICRGQKITHLTPLDFVGSYQIKLLNGEDKKLFAPNHHQLKLQYQYLKANHYPVAVQEKVKNAEGMLCLTADDLISFDQSNILSNLPYETFTIDKNTSTLVGYIIV
ncbi:MAG: hypothetical protein CMM87_00280 [Rickettsiales bacterium]|nr:hypothetical protein [Rickettsiales bacterium]|tara:strand:+ start:8363 stop:9202 length:840 start_codon:yes stop_codon:yes gene_type:complete